jgi:hypothetical protein
MTPLRGGTWTPFSKITCCLSAAGVPSRLKSGFCDVDLVRTFHGYNRALELLGEVTSAIGRQFFLRERQIVLDKSAATL